MLRIVVAALAIIEGLLVLAIVVGGILTESDPAGDAMAAGAAFLAVAAGALFIGPALLMAYHNRYLGYGLALVLAPLLLPAVAAFL